MRDAATSSAAGKASAELSLAGNALEGLQTHDETMHMKDRTTTVNGVAQADRELVADEFAATAGEDGRTACETCPLLLAAIGGEPSDETVVWQYAQADRRAVASGGIAGAVGAGKSIQSQEGTEECLTKPDGKVAASSWGLALPQSGPYPKPWARPKKINMRWNSWMGI